MKRTALIASAACLLLNACGPGTGGSGLVAESQDYLRQAGAQAAPVCGAAWATQLSCNPPAGTIGVAPSQAGTAKLQFGSSLSNPEFVLSFEGNQLQLEGACPRLSFSGDWGLLPSGQSAFVGAYLDAGLIQPVLALAVVTTSTGPDGSPRLQVELRSPAGQSLLAALPAQKLPGTNESPRRCP